jgi:predicted O-methyltransferase YrrM
VDVERLLRELPARFADFPCSEMPLDRSLQPLCEAVEGLSEENNLALLALAAGCLGDGECYAEAGSYRGRSLIAAAVGGAGTAIGIDNFSFDDSDPVGLAANVERFGVTDRVRVIDGDTVAVLGEDQLPPIGVFFYDADHSTAATRAALDAVRPLLAGSALIVVDDAEWPRVRAATDAFVSANPEAKLRLRIAGRADGQPWWWDGMDLVAWTREQPVPGTGYSARERTASTSRPSCSRSASTESNRSSSRSRWVRSSRIGDP